MRRNRPNSSTGKHHGGGGYVDYDDGDFAFMPAGPKPKKPGNKGQARGGFRGRGRGGRGGSDRGRGGSDRGRGADRGRGGGRGNDRGRGGSEGNRYGGSSSNDFPSSRGRGTDSRVQMQHLYMSNENQDMVRDVLFAIRRGDYETIDSFGDDDQNGKDDDVYGDQDYELEDEDDDDDDEEEDESYYDNRHDDKQYWITDKNLVIEDTTSYAEMDAEEIPKLQYKTMNNQFAIQRLMRCGFHKSRCQDALQLYNDDIGAALDFLLCECFELEYNPSQSSEQLTQEILDARSEEMMVLQGIFEDRFEERLSNKIWILNLELPHLAELSKPTFELKSHSRGSKVKVDTDKRALCKYFSSKVGCRFGSKCKFKHAPKENPNIVEAIAEPLREAETPKCPFQLEIRFVDGNKYPQEPPLVIFSSILDYFPQHGALNITQHLFNEAKSLSEFHSPVVFSIASLLEEDNTGTLIEILQRPPSACSLPKPIISMKQFQEREETNEKMERVSIPQNKPDDDKTTENGKAAMLRMVDRDEERRSENKKKSDNDPKPIEKYGRKNTKTASQIESSPFNKRLKDDFIRKLDSKGYKDRQTSRSRLPAWDMKEEILKTLEDNQVTVISGMTGCGKTTQVPQFILESYLSSGKNKMCNIICTQPRRISAIAVAQRVAQEQVDKIGKLVGYQIRLENIQSASTRLLFCTTGIILRRLEGDPMLHGVSHLIIDEVHERTEESDFLMMILRDLLVTRTDLKVILMSATLNADLFSQYFGCCPTVEIPGKTFPVEQFFLEDAIESTGYIMEDASPYSRSLQQSNAYPQTKSRNLPQYLEDIDDQLKSLSLLSNDDPPNERKQDQNLTVKELFVRYCEYGKKTLRTLAIMDLEKINYELIVELLEWIIGGKHQHPPGAILIFLPGFAEITVLYELLQGNPEFGFRNKNRFKIIPLHSTLSSEDQNSVFVRPKDGVTKIVIATNIAETSITIDDIVYVIDAGRMKEKRYDASKGMESLETVWVSRANALQRKGRAGRVTNGVCFHLFTKNRFEHHLREQPIPEIQRAPLEGICLKIKMLELFKDRTIQKILSKLLEPPKDEAIDSAIKRLQDLGALDEKIELTPLGYHLGSLPVDPRIGKLMLFGAIFRCLSPALTIAATLSYQSPFITPFGKKEEATEKKCKLAVGNSDHLTMVKAYNEWMKAKERSGHEAYVYCRDNFLSSKNLQMLSSLKQQFVELLSDIGFVKTGIKLRDVERAGGHNSDGVKEITGPEANINSGNWRLMSAILVGALYPNVVQVLTPEQRYVQSSAGAVLRDPKAKELKFKTKPDGYVHIHPSSVNFQIRHYESPYLVYHEKVKTSRIYVRDCTMVSVYPLLLFGGASISVDLQRGNFIMSVDDGWIRFMATKHEIAELVRELRKELDQLLSDKINDPNMDLCTCPRGSRIIETIVKLITTQ